MVFALLALQLLGNADSVQIGAGQAIDQAVTTSLANNKLQTKQATEQGAERYTVQVYAGRRIDANSLYMRLTDSVGAVLPVVMANFPTSFAVQAPNERFKKNASSN